LPLVEVAPEPVDLDLAVHVALPELGDGEQLERLPVVTAGPLAGERRVHRDDSQQQKERRDGDGGDRGLEPNPPSLAGA